MALRFVGPTELVERVGQIVEGIGIGWLALDRLNEGGECLFALSDVCQGHSQVIPCFDVVGVELHGLPEAFDRRLVLAPATSTLPRLKQTKASGPKSSSER